MMPAPERGFSQAEFEQRLARAQQQMAAQQLDAILLTTEPEVRYFTGFQTQFWESPTRPWYTILPLTGKPIAVIPEIGAAGMRATWVEDIRTWPSPRPQDDGISLVAAALTNLPARFGRIGVPLGRESTLRMPLGDFRKLSDKLQPAEVADAAMLLHQLRYVKSEAEIRKMHYICDLTSAAFEALPQSLVMGQSERVNCQRFRMDLLQRGADNSPYLIAGSGPDGYDNIIMGPTDRLLTEGDVLIIDTGTTFDGYFCDFDRNFAFGHASAAARRAYDVVYRATDAGFAAAYPGATTSDVWTAMWAVLEAGVVLTLEPGMTFAPGKQMVHEENIVITEDGAQWLSRRAPAAMPVIDTTE